MDLPDGPRPGLRAPADRSSRSPVGRRTIRRAIAVSLLFASILPYGRSGLCRSADGPHAHGALGAERALAPLAESGAEMSDCHRAMACGVTLLALRRFPEVVAAAPGISERAAVDPLARHDRPTPPPTPPPPRA